MHDIPVCCKISLEGQTPPLYIKVSGLKKGDNLNIYTSYTHVDPSATNNSEAFPSFRGNTLRFNGEHNGPRVGTKIFVSKWLYLTLISSLGCSLELVPLFVDP